MRNKIWAVAATLTLSLMLLCVGCTDIDHNSTYTTVTQEEIESYPDDGAQQEIESDPDDSAQQEIESYPDDNVQQTIKEIPDKGETAYAVLNGNVPEFTEDEITTASFEEYAELDGLGRCGAAFACIGTDLMPTQERGSIGQVRPSGWHTVKYDIVDGNYLYNRCHLIAYQLAGENANERNLITGTRYLNVEGMLPFEEKVADYVRETDNHVMYRVTPYFDGDNLLAGGVQMEALSVEDDGAGVCFNVFVYNIQPGIEIDYASGESGLMEEADISEGENVAGADISEGENAAQADISEGENVAQAGISEEEKAAGASLEEDQDAASGDEDARDYVLNNNTMKFHYADCSSAKKIKEKNKESFHGSRQWLVDNGYSPCGNCKP